MSDNRDDKQEALEALLQGDPSTFVGDWLTAIDAAEEEEKPWREQMAEDALAAYKGDSSSRSTSFNIFHSNIETLVPALYNSSPIPDVRRRFLDEDPVAAQVADMIERAISFSIDDYDFDDTMRRVVKDMAVVDRGLARIRYNPTFADNAEPDAEPEYQEARCEYVPWRSFRRGPAATWDKLPWIAFEHYLPRSEVEKLVRASHFAPEVQARILADVRYSHSAESKGDKKDPAKEVPKFGARARVWEIEDKDTRTIVWICADYKDYPLCIMPDVLGLKDFFSTPRPAMVIEATDSLTPITSYSIYARLIDELNEVTDRIANLVGQIRVRGGYAGVSSEIEMIAKASDGELIPLANAELFATTGGGLDKAIVWFPIEPVVAAVKELVVQREQIKATIYEVTGLSDIIRGATDPNETATAQNIKQQWGSVRVQSHQKEVERYARDLFRLKAEVYCKHFSMPMLLAMTGIRIPTQEDHQRAEQMKQMGEQTIAQLQQQAQAAEAEGQDPTPFQQEVQQLQQQFADAARQVEEILSKPTLDEVEALMRDSRVLKYRVDIESDSTIRADLSKNQEQMKGFLDGTAAYAAAVGPMVQEGVMDGQVAVEIFSAFARNFRLGKQAEDALDQWADKIKKGGVPGKGPDPVAQADAAKKAAETEKIKVETQLLPQQHQADMQDRAAARNDTKAKMDFEREKHGDEMSLQRDQLDHTKQVADREHERSNRELDLKEDQADSADELAGRQQDLAESQFKDTRTARYETFKADGKDIAPPAEPEEEDDDMPLNRRDMKHLEDTQFAVEQVGQAIQGLAQMMQQVMQMQMQQTQALTDAVQQLAAAQAAPKRIVRDGSGRAVGVQPVSGGAGGPPPQPAPGGPGGMA